MSGTRQWQALQQSGALEGLAGYQFEVEVNWRGPSQSISLVPLIVTANFFDVLGVPVAMGRGFTAAEADAERNPNLAVVSHGFWQAAARRRSRGRRPDARLQRACPTRCWASFPGAPRISGLRPRAGSLSASEPAVDAGSRRTARGRGGARRPVARRTKRGRREEPRWRLPVNVSARSPTTRGSATPSQFSPVGGLGGEFATVGGLLRRAPHRRRSDPRDRLRQRGRPAPGAQHRPAARDCDPRRARREPRAAGPAAADGRVVARRVRHGLRSAADVVPDDADQADHAAGADADRGARRDSTAGFSCTRRSS